MNRTRSVLLLASADGMEQPQLLEDAARLAAGRSARLVVCNTKPPVPPCERRPAGHRRRSTDLVKTAVGCADAVRAALVVFAVGRRQSENAVDVGRLIRACKRDVLVMSHPVTRGCVVAVVDPSAGEAVNAVVLGTALAHSHLHRADLHVVGGIGGPASCATIANLLEPICGLDPSHIHLVGSDPLQSIGMVTRHFGAGLVVLGSPVRPNTEDAARIVRHILPYSSVMVTNSSSADDGSTSADANH